MTSMDSELQKKIISLCSHGNKLTGQREYAFAISKFYEALSLVPDPKKDYKATTFIYTSIGECYWLQRDYRNAGKAFSRAIQCPEGADSANINFRLGQCLFECDELDYAKEYLLAAYMLGSESLFLSSDPKYYELIRREIEGPSEDEMEVTSDDYDMVSNIISGSRAARGDDSDTFSGDVRARYIEDGYEPVRVKRREAPPPDRGDYGDDSDDLGDIDDDREYYNPSFGERLKDYLKTFIDLFK